MRNIRFVILLTAAWLSPLPAISSECDNWQTAHAEWLWCDDFEGTSSLSSRYEDVSSTGMSQSTNDALEGLSSLEQLYSPGQVNAGWIVKVMDSGYPDHLFYRYYHKFGPGYSNYPPKMARVGYRRRNSDWQSVFMLHSWLTSSGEVVLDTQAINSSQANSSGWLTKRHSGWSFSDHVNEWAAIEVELKLNTPGSSDGLFRMWINDQLVIESLNLDLRGNTSDKINEVMLDAYWNIGASANLYRYYDNFVISTQKIGLVGATNPGGPVSACNAPSNYSPLLNNPA